MLKIFIYILLLDTVLVVYLIHSAPVENEAPAGLYGGYPDVINLNSTNYDRRTVGSKQAWLMQFYNSWCGHCINFAKLYGPLATDLKDWQEVLLLGAVDCAHEANGKLCRDHNLRQYPTLLLLPAHASTRSNGTSIRQYTTIDEFRAALYNFITNTTMSQIEPEKSNLLSLIALDARSTKPIAAQDSDTGSRLQLYQNNESIPTSDSIIVHSQDLVSGLHYSLRHEVSLHHTLSESALQALKLYIKVLSVYLPVEESVSKFLQSIDAWLQTYSQPLTGDVWLTSINKLQTDEARLAEVQRWSGCAGSEPKYRGYPCSLWTTFHALTVAAYVNERSDVDAQTVLLAIRSYVQHFFTCTECSRNFMLETAHIKLKAHTSRDAVLYLWRVHNKVNLRLAGDSTEDPKHPKIQFPAVQQCRACHISYSNSSSSWNEDSVLTFIRDTYIKSSIVQDSAVVSNSNSINGERSDIDVLLKMERFDMSHIDIGLCFAFYVVCMLILILGYFHVSRHRRPSSCLRLFSV